MSDKMTENYKHKNLECKKISSAFRITKEELEQAKSDSFMQQYLEQEAKRVVKAAEQDFVDRELSDLGVVKVHKNTCDYNYTVFFNTGEKPMQLNVMDMSNADDPVKYIRQKIVRHKSGPLGKLDWSAAGHVPNLAEVIPGYHDKDGRGVGTCLRCGKVTPKKFYTTRKVNIDGDISDFKLNIGCVFCWNDDLKKPYCKHCGDLMFHKWPKMNDWYCSRHGWESK